MIKFTDYEGHRLRIMPTNFTTVQTRFQRDPVPVIYADVTVLNVLDKPQDLGNVAIFPKTVVHQLKDAWVGRPIIGTLITRQIDFRPGFPPSYMLDDLEVE